MMALPLRALLADVCKLVKLEPAEVIEAGELEVDGILVVISSVPDDDHVTITLLLGTPEDSKLQLSLSRQLLMREFEHAGEAVALHFAMNPRTSEIIATLTLPLPELATGSDLMEVIELAIDEANDELEDATALALAEEMVAKNERDGYSASGDDAMYA
jgi:hypothetical protein